MWKKWLIAAAKEADLQGKLFLQLEQKGVMAQPDFLSEALMELGDCAEKIACATPALRKPCARIRRLAERCRSELRDLAGHTTHSDRALVIRHSLELRLPLVADVAKTMASSRSLRAA